MSVINFVYDLQQIKMSTSNWILNKRDVETESIPLRYLIGNAQQSRHANDNIMTICCKGCLPLSLSIRLEVLAFIIWGGAWKKTLKWHLINRKIPLPNCFLLPCTEKENLRSRVTNGCFPHHFIYGLPMLVTSRPNQVTIHRQ